MDPGNQSPCTHAYAPRSALEPSGFSGWSAYGLFYEGDREDANGTSIRRVHPYKKRGPKVAVPFTGIMLSLNLS